MPTVNTRYQTLKSMLETRREELETSLTSLRRELSEGASVLPKVHREIKKSLIQIKKDTIVKLDEALRRLEAGTYGNCFECEEEIDEARLQAIPFAVKCRKCGGHLR